MKRWITFKHGRLGFLGTFLLPAMAFVLADIFKPFSIEPVGKSDVVLGIISGATVAVLLGLALLRATPPGFFSGLLFVGVGSVWNALMFAVIRGIFTDSFSAICGTFFFVFLIGLVGGVCGGLVLGAVLYLVTLPTLRCTEFAPKIARRIERMYRNSSSPRREIPSASKRT